jgi:hypothetical protein
MNMCQARDMFQAGDLTTGYTEDLCVLCVSSVVNSASQNPL